MTWKKVNNSDAGTATKHGGNDIDKITDAFNGVDVSDPIKYNTDINTLYATTNAAGDLLKSNGTKFVRLARGTANQVLAVNAGGTDLAWATGGGGGATNLDGLSDVAITSAAQGDIIARNATQYVNKAKGTALQILRTNSGATDIEWATLDNERVGKSQASGNASTTVFNIAHGVGSNPTYAFVNCSSQTIDFTYVTDATNIVVTFATAPASGTNNVVMYWRVVA
jgi:hypothetical protein